MAQETFTNSGTWTCPAGVTSIQVECWGGAGGTGVSSTGEGGGGGGAYSIDTAVAVTPGNNYAYTIGIVAAPGAAGGDTYWVDSSTVLAKGGGAGSGATGGTGGDAAAGVGDTKYSGGNGGNCSDTFSGGGGGSSAGTAANGGNGANGQIRITYTVPAAITATGTLVETTASVTRESHIVVGGRTLILTVANDTWVAAGATFDAQRQNIIDGIDSAQAEAAGWDATVKATQGVSGVVRTSSTVVTITLDAQASYAITANELITATIPATALTGGNAVVASPTFRVVDDRPRSANLLGGLGVGREPPPRNMGDVRSGLVPMHWKDTRQR